MSLTVAHTLGSKIIQMKGKVSEIARKKGFPGDCVILLLHHINLTVRMSKGDAKILQKK